MLFDSTGDRIYLDGIKNGAIIGISKYLKYMPFFQKYSYKESWDAFKVMGTDEIYGLPRTSIARADGFYVRKDWLANLKVANPEGRAVELAELNDLLKAFTKNDPDGNGKADTWGLRRRLRLRGQPGAHLRREPTASWAGRSTTARTTRT